VLRLVDGDSVVEVLSDCRVQQQKTGNPLRILRRAAMQFFCFSSLT